MRQRHRAWPTPPRATPPTPPAGAPLTLGQWGQGPVDPSQAPPQAPAAATSTPGRPSEPPKQAAPRGSRLRLESHAISIALEDFKP